MPSMVIETVSPSSMGPTPAGVPVRMRSPGSKVITAEIHSTIGADVVNHQRGTAVLLDFAVDVGAQFQIGRVERSVTIHGPDRAKGVMSLGPGPLAVGFLLIAGRHVVADGVAEDVLRGLGGRDVLAGPADDHRQLALECTGDALAGNRIGTFGPMIAVLGLRKITGSAGAGPVIPSSRRCDRRSSYRRTPPCWPVSGPAAARRPAATIGR